MFSLSSKQIKDLQAKQNENWVQSHVLEMTRLLPDFVAMYSPDEFRALVVRMLHRADRQGLRLRNASVAFCFASIKLGIGFEDEPEHTWFADGLHGPQDGWANAIWDGLESAMSHTEKEAF